MQPADPTRCCCCHTNDDVQQNIAMPWTPSPGHGYGENGALLSLCRTCIGTLQWFVELPGTQAKVARVVDG